jgi:hypothetical protein
VSWNVLNLLQYNYENVDVASHGNTMIVLPIVSSLLILGFGFTEFKALPPTGIICGLLIFEFQNHSYISRKKCIGHRTPAMKTQSQLNCGRCSLERSNFYLTDRSIKFQLCLMVAAVAQEFGY